MPMLFERIGRILGELSRHLLPAERSVSLGVPGVLTESERPTEETLCRLAAPGGWPTDEAAETDYIKAEAYRYYVIRYQYETPEELAGQSLMFRLKTGDRHAWTRDTPFNRDLGWSAANPQFTAVVNGEIYAGLDEYHQMFYLDETAEAGKTYEIVLMHYTGHDPTSFPVEAYVTPLNKEVKDYFFDLKVPYDVVSLLSPENQDRINAIEALNGSLNQLDMRKPGSEDFLASVNEARDYLAKNYYERYGDSSKEPVIKTVGHTHIDIAWLWPLSMTEDKTVRSFSTVLENMRRYPDYLFMSSQPQLYQYIEDLAPSMFEQIKARVAEGRWEVEGGMWIEADCNVGSGEALARQFLYGKRYFRERFNKDNRILWLPDVFGYSAALPQLMKLAEIDYFMTTKISWNETNKLPVDTFMWEGIDGSKVLTHFSPPMNYHALADFFPNVVKGFTTYNATMTASQVLGSWQRYQQKSLNKEVLMLVGHGDGGGGTNMEMLENERRFAKGLPAAPRTEISTARAFFEKLEEDVGGRKDLPIWEGELYLEYHRGTYTTLARNKRWNRQSEFAYQGAEKLRVMAEHLLGMPYPAEALHQGWIILLRNQFHDILPGSSITEVYEDSDREYADVFAYSEKITREVLTALLQAKHAQGSGSDDTVLLTNTQSFPRTEWIELDAPGEGDWYLVGVDDESDPNQSELIRPSQDTADGKILVMTPEVPAMGYRLARFVKAEAASKPETAFNPEEPVLENDSLRLVFNSEGRLTSFYDKRAEREILKDGEVGNDLVTFEDKPIHYDAWDIADYYTEKSWKVPGASAMELVEDGEVRKTLKLVFDAEEFSIKEYVHLYADDARVDLDFEVDWHPRHQLLKLFFPLDINGYMATYEIQYGSVTRTMHRNTSWDEARFEVANQKWLDVGENNYGVSFINDSKYGSSLNQGVLGLTLLKSSTWPSETADREVHHFSYSVRPHLGDWRDSDIVRESYAFNNPLLITDSHDVHGFYDHLPPGLEEARERGTVEKLAGKRDGAAESPIEEQLPELPASWSLAGTSDANVIIEAVKQAEDGDGFVLRLYEAFGRRSRATVTCSVPFEAVTEVNLLENEASDEMKDGSSLAVSEGSFSFNLLPYEIKSFRVK